MPSTTDEDVVILSGRGVAPLVARAGIDDVNS